MGVYARPNSKFWWALLEGTDDGNGNPIRFSTKIPRAGATSTQTRENRALAHSAYNARMVDIARERYELPLPRLTRTFDQQASWYEANHTVHHRGAGPELTKIARLRAFFGRDRLERITPDRWQEYLTERTTQDGVVPSTVGRELAIMRRILLTAIPTYLETFPLFGVKRTNAKLKAKRTISAADERRLLAAFGDAAVQSAMRNRTSGRAARDRGAREELRDLYLVGVGTLLRQSTLMHLRRGEFRGDRLAVVTKTGPHEIPLKGPTPMQRRAASVLKRRMPKSHDGFFFPIWQARFADDRDGANAQFLRAFRRACRRAGIPWGLPNDGVVWHTGTRASGATRMLREYRVDVRTVQMFGNWASLDQMADYLGVDLDLYGKQAIA